MLLTKDMVDLVKYILDQKSWKFRAREALIDLIKQKARGQSDHAEGVTG